MPKDSTARRRPLRTGVSPSLESYRKEHPLTKKVPDVKLVGKLRELIVPSGDGEEVRSMHSFSTAEAAMALGRTLLTFSKWKEDGRIPPPVCRDHSRGWGYYIQEEIDAISASLVIHERSYHYYGLGHTETRARIRRAVSEVRHQIFSIPR